MAGAVAPWWRGSHAHPAPPQIMLLETARRYNHETESITFLKDFTYSKDDFHRAGMQWQGCWHRVHGGASGWYRGVQQAGGGDQGSSGGMNRGVIGAGVLGAQRRPLGGALEGLLGLQSMSCRVKEEAINPNLDGPWGWLLGGWDFRDVWWDMGGPSKARGFPMRCEFQGGLGGIWGFSVG